MMAVKTEAEFFIHLLEPLITGSEGRGRFVECESYCARRTHENDKIQRNYAREAHGQHSEAFSALKAAFRGRTEILTIIAPAGRDRYF